MHLGIQFVTNFLVFLGLGYFLDSYFEKTFPLFFIAIGFLGFIGCFIWIVYKTEE